MANAATWKPLLSGILCAVLAMALACGQNTPASKGAESAKAPLPPVSLQLNGQKYDNLEFVSAKEDLVILISAQGPVRVKWAELPQDIQQRFAKEYADFQNQQQAKVIDNLRAEVNISGRIVEKLPQGILVSWGGQIAFLIGHPNEASLAKGGPISVTAQRTGSFQHTGADGVAKTLRKFKVITASP